LIAAAALAVATAVVALTAPFASAGSAPGAPISIPAWMTRIQYPGTSSEPTVYINSHVAIPAWLARIQYPGTYPGASVVFPRVQSAPAARSTVVPASSPGFDWGAFGIGVAAATGVAFLGAGAVLALRRRQTPAHV
jgi:hypothetical protein